MFKYLPCLLLCLLLMQQAFATTPVYKDTAILPKAARLSQQQFLDAYGTNDTSCALIQYYFKRNKKAKRDVLIRSIVGIGAGVAFDQIIMGGSGGDALGALAIGLLLGSVIYVGAFVVLLGIFKWIHFSRQRLAVQLQRYRNGTPLPGFIIRNRIFQKFLAVERKASQK